MTSAFTPDLIASLALFAFASSITPGPNNTMLMASGANFGLRASVPHMAGVSAGFIFLLAAVGLGLGSLFKAYPALHDILKIAGAAYLLWLAWKLANSKGIGGGAVGGTPQTFWQAVAFQWVNPKAWVMAISAITTYTPPENYLQSMALVALVVGAINLPCIAVWTSFGVGLRHFLDRPNVLRAFNWGMAALLVLSLYPVALELFG